MLSLHTPLLTNPMWCLTLLSQVSWPLFSKCLLGGACSLMGVKMWTITSLLLLAQSSLAHLSSSSMPINPCQVEPSHGSELLLFLDLGCTLTNSSQFGFTWHCWTSCIGLLHHREGVMSGDDLQVIHFFYFFLIHGLFLLCISPMVYSLYFYP